MYLYTNTHTHSQEVVTIVEPCVLFTEEVHFLKQVRTEFSNEMWIVVVVLDPSGQFVIFLRICRGQVTVTMFSSAEGKCKGYIFGNGKPQDLDEEFLAFKNSWLLKDHFFFAGLLELNPPVNPSTTVLNHDIT